jgi:histidine phosphotransferase ChpT
VTSPSAPGAIDFASLLCSKLCHDLLNPVGAMSNGIELLADETDPVMREQCLGLLADSARTTAAKLKYFRIAFGAAGGYGDALPARELKDALLGLFPASGRLAINWLVGEEMLPKMAGKLLLNMSTIVGDALPRGGSLTIGGEVRGGVCEIVVRGEGPMIKLDPEIRGTLGQAIAGTPTARSAPAWMVRELISQAKGELVLNGEGEPLLMLGATLAV